MQNRDIKSQIKQAEVSFKQGNIQDAVKQLMDLDNKHPDNPQILNNLGVICYTLGKLEEASGFLNRATIVDPNFKQALKNFEAVASSMMQNEESKDINEPIEQQVDTQKEIIHNENNYNRITTEDNLVVYLPRKTQDVTSDIQKIQRSTEESELSFIREYIESEMIVLDADTGDGFFALTMANEMEGEGRVIVQNTNKLFHRSAEENGFQNLISTELGDSSLDFIHLGSEDIERSYFTQGSPLVMFLTNEERIQIIKDLNMDIYEHNINQNILIPITNLEKISEGYIYACDIHRSEIMQNEGLIATRNDLSKDRIY